MTSTPSTLQRRGQGIVSTALQALAVLLVFAIHASAQVGFQFPAPVNVGTASPTELVPVQVGTPGVLGSIQVLTQGALNLDFSTSSGGTCVPGAPVGPVCTVAVSMTPTYPGVRNGAIVLLDASGNQIGAEPVQGIGIGPLGVLTAGEITTVAGSGHLTNGVITSHLAIDAAVREPLGVAVDGAGNFYFTDSGNEKIGKVDTNGNLTYIAGTGGAGYSPNGTPATSALISEPAAILVDGAGNVFFTEIGNSTVREIVNATGMIQTVAGTGIQGFSGVNGPATAANLNMPQGIAFDGAYNLYIADTGNNVIRRINAVDGTISTLAGDGNPGFAGDNGAAAGAELDQPYGLSFGSDGSLYIADFLNNRIRKINPAGIISTVAGSGNAGYSGDTRAALGANMNHPSSVGVDAGGNLYISDSENNVVRKVNASTLNITTYAGNSAANSTGDGVNADNGTPSMNKTYGLVLDSADNLFIADRLGLRVREVFGTQARILYRDIKVTNTSAPVPQRLDNDGNSPLQLSAITPVSNAAVDPATTTCSVTVPMAPGAECLIGVEFKPSVVGSPVVGTITITSNAANTPDTILLSGKALSIEPSTVTLVASLNPSAVGQIVTFTATINSLAPQVQGTVNFYADGTLIGSPTSDPNKRTAAVQISTLTAGSHTITAAFLGDASTAPSNTTPFDPSAMLTQVVKQTSSLTLTSSNPQARLQDPITFTAQVVGVSSLMQGETVVFVDTTTGTTLDTEPVDPGSGIAISRAITTLSAGQHTITATYSGDVNYAGSSASLVQTIQKISTVLAITPSANPSVAGGTVSFTILVTAQYSTIAVTGTVSLADNGTPLQGSFPVTALATDPSTATVTVPVAALSTGTHNITATYSGDTNYLGTTGSYSQSVVAATSTVVLRASSATAIATTPVTFTAAVTGNGGTPGGTVNFSIDGGTPISGTLSNGAAAIVTSNLPVGSHTVIASYLGDTNDGPATSNQVTVTIVAATTTTTLTSSQNPMLTLAPVTITATVTNVGGATPKGSVTFSQDGAAVSTALVNTAGVATLSLPSLSAGTHTFIATYSGDAINLASTSAAYSEVVQLRATTDSLTTSATSLSGGQQLTLISIVRWTGATTPTGTVSFLEGTQTLATAPIDATGVATVTVLLSGTSANLSSVYSGDAFYATSTSTISLVSIGPAPNFNFTATPDTFSLVTSQHRTMIVTVASLQGFTDTLSLGCIGLPLATTCNFSTDQFVLAANGNQTVQLTVDTASPLLAGAQAKNEGPTPLGLSSAKLIAACFLPGGLLLGFIGLRFRRLRGLGSLGSLIMLAVLLAGMATTLTGCGTIQLTSTPPGVYNFAVTATGKTGVSQTIPVTMTVTSK